MTRTEQQRAEEIKGFFRDDAKVKTKVFAALFPIPLTVLMLKGGTWTRTEITP